MASLPVDLAACWALPERRVPCTHALGHQVPHLLEPRGHQGGVAERAPRERVDESEVECGGHFSNLLLQIVAMHAKSAMRPACELLVPCQEGPVLTLGEGKQLRVVERPGVRGVVAHEP